MRFRFIVRAVSRSLVHRKVWYQPNLVFYDSFHKTREQTLGWMDVFQQMSTNTQSNPNILQHTHRNPVSITSQSDTVEKWTVAHQAVCTPIVVHRCPFTDNDCGALCYLFTMAVTVYNTWTASTLICQADFHLASTRWYSQKSSASRLSQDKSSDCEL